jgi:Yip1 domain
LFVSARILQGTGTFKDQAYAFALYSVPINGVSAIVGLIPVLGQLASFALGIYSLVLAVLAMAASQRLTIGRAIWAIVLPIILLVVLACVLVVVVAVIAAALIRNAPTTP